MRSLPRPTICVVVQIDEICVSNQKALKRQLELTKDVVNERESLKTELAASRAEAESDLKSLEVKLRLIWQFKVIGVPVVHESLELLLCRCRKRKMLKQPSPACPRCWRRRLQSCLSKSERSKMK